MKISINKKRAQRIRSKLKSVNVSRYRLSIHRSTKNISAQIIDDKSNIKYPKRVDSKDPVKTPIFTPLK